MPPRQAAVAASQLLSTGQSAAAALLALLILLVDPVVQSLIPAHFAMMTIIAFWIFAKSPRAVFVVAMLALAFSAYLLAVGQVISPGERVVGESVKYSILTLFVFALMSFQSFTRASLYYMAIIVPIATLIYIFVSPNPLIYGDRLAIPISGLNDEAVVSPNTIGFLINICIATILARGNKAFVYMIPAFLYIIYLTLSRGALLSLGIMGIAYFLRTGRTFYVVLLGFAALLIVIDVNTASFVTTFRLDDATGSGRTIIYEMLFEDIRANPITLLLGHGPGNINVEIYTGKTLVSAHSGYVDLLYTFGIPGLLLWIYLFVRTTQFWRRLPLDSFLYVALFAGYAISEDLMGAHNLLPMGLMLGVILRDFKQLGQMPMRTSYRPPNAAIAA